MAAVSDDPHDSPALVAATAALTKAQADLAAARERLKVATDRLTVAKAVHTRAQNDLRDARLAEQAAARALATVRQNISVQQTRLGQLARSAYQAEGPFGQLSLVLASKTPEQLTDRLAFVQSVTNAGNAIIENLRVEQADLATYSARLAASLQRQEAVTSAAAAALEATAAAAREARDAERALAASVRVQTAALAFALKAKAADQQRYHLFSVESGALAGRIRALAAQLAASSRPPHGTGKFVRPGTGPITSPFGPRMHPILHYVKIHTGLDLGRGDGISYAADSGVVLLTEFNRAYGNMTVIDHGTVGGLHITTLYAHQAAFAVQPGQRVRKGQPIGAIGATGYATGPHLHFEVRIDGTPLDPAPFLVRAALPSAARAP